MYSRINGIRCIGAVGNDDQKHILARATLDDNTLSDERIISEIISALSPDYLSIDEIVSLCSRLEISDRYHASWIRNSLENFVKIKYPEKSLIKWIDSILTLIKQPPFIEKKYCNISKKYSWLLSDAMYAIERLVEIDASLLLDDAVLEIISLTQRARDYNVHYDESKIIKNTVSSCSELNSALFWFDVQSVRKQEHDKNKRLTSWLQAGAYNSYWNFTENDFDLVLEDIDKKQNFDDKLVALSLAFHIYRESGRDRGRLNRMKKSVVRISELEESLHGFLHPPKITDVQKEHQRSHARWKRGQKHRKLVKLENKKKWKKWLLKNTHVLRVTIGASEGEVQGGIDYLIKIIRDHSDRNDRWTRNDWRSLIPEFGVNVAEALRDGCIGYWREL